jgi:phenylacetate-CoA ligase
MIRYALAVRRMLKNQKLPAPKLEALRVGRLQAVIRNAYNHVPYYRSLFRQARLSADDIRSFEDLKEVPITTKDNINASSPEDMTADWAPLDSLFPWRTSGSTGMPLTVYRNTSERMTHSALLFASLISSGLRPFDRLATLGPSISIPEWPYRRFRVYESRIVGLALPLDEQIRQLKEFQPTVLRIFPSALRSLIHHMDGSLGNVIRPRMVITAGEVFDAALRNRAQATLKTEFFNHYGAIELGRMAWDCSKHTGLHVNAEHFILECMEDEQSSGMGGAGVAVVTSLYAFAMPFIRYRLGDLCVPLEGSCPCGRSFPLIAPPLGRENDVLTLPSGKILSSLGLGTIINEYAGIERWRVIQETPEDFTLRLVMKDKPEADLFRTMRAQILAYLGEPVNLNIQLVEFIVEDTPKFRSFVSKVSP